MKGTVKMKTEITIPTSTATASIAFVLDVRNERETLIIGSYENIRSYLKKGKTGSDIQISSRKLGTLAEEMNELAMADNRMDEIIEASNGLYNNISEALGKQKCRTVHFSTERHLQQSAKSKYAPELHYFLYFYKLYAYSQGAER